MKIKNKILSAIAIAGIALSSIVPIQADTLSVEVGEFENEYDLSSSTAYIIAEKELDGRDLNSGEFSFILYDDDGEEVETVTNDSDGDIAFTGIEITEAGTYTYTIEEEEGSLGGITYDDTVFTVTITATENEDDECIDLEIEYTSDDDDAEFDDDGYPVFQNVYDDGSVTVTLTATKVLNNDTLTAGEFKFQLMDSDYDVLTTTTNKADGSITLGTLSIGSEGTYTYYVQEVAGTDSNIEYDTNIYTITITVTDDGEGTLTAEVSDSPTFTNTYVTSSTTSDDDDDDDTNVASVDDDDDASDYRTGDDIKFGVTVGLIIAALGLFLLIYFKKFLH